MNGVSVARHEPGPAALFWRVKLRLGLNYLRDVKRHILLHATVGLGVLTFMLVGGFFLFEFIFEFLVKPEQQPFGGPLLKRLVGMVLLAFFSMLTFSNLIIMLMSIELMLLAVNMNFVAFSTWAGDTAGQVFVFFILTVAAAEAAIGLAILVLLFRNLNTINVDELDRLKG